MNPSVDHELRTRILTEIQAATNQPLRHNAREHKFWARLNPEHIPDKIVIPTNSYRKIVLFVLQFLALNEEAMPEFFEEYGQDPLVFLETIKRAFHNGNGESRSEMYIGELFGVPLYAQPTDGEKHEPGLTQEQEARNKGSWLAENPYNGEDNTNTWYMGFDTLDGIWIRDDTGALHPLGHLPKPTSWPDFPADWRSQPEEYRQFKTDAVMNKFPDHGVIEGVTAGVVMKRADQDLEGTNADIRLDELAIGFSSIRTEISQERLLAVIDQFDPNASAFGVLQLLIEWEKQEMPADQQLMEQYFADLAPEKRQIAAFFLLAQIMGAPAWLVVELAAEAVRGLSNQEEALITRKYRSMKPAVNTAKTG